MAIIVDTRGKLCPLPLILFRKAINEHPEETEFQIFTDNRISCSNLIDFIHQHAYEYTEEKVDVDSSILRVKVTREVRAGEETKSGSARLERGIRVLQLRSDHMGVGDDKLGEILILAYLNAMKELDEKPTHILCYNSGVKLATKNHEASKSLIELAGCGIEVIVCGTCTNFYGITDDIVVGKIGNMFTIAETLQNADHIVTP